MRQLVRGGPASATYEDLWWHLSGPHSDAAACQRWPGTCPGAVCEAAAASVEVTTQFVHQQALSSLPYRFNITHRSLPDREPIESWCSENLDCVTLSQDEGNAVRPKMRVAHMSEATLS